MRTTEGLTDVNTYVHPNHNEFKRVSAKDWILIVFG